MRARRGCHNIHNNNLTNLAEGAKARVRKLRAIDLTTLYATTPNRAACSA